MPEIINDPPVGRELAAQLITEKLVRGLQLGRGRTGTENEE
jgi:hypothetical protein